MSNNSQGTGRLVANIRTDEFQSLDMFPGYKGSSTLAVDPTQEAGVGFHIYKMEPGSSTTPHVHTSDEHFYIIEGDLMDNDGYVYTAGDIVMMAKDSIHSSSTVNGCLMVAYAETVETNL